MSIPTDVVTVFTPLPGGRGRLFRMEPGKRILLNRWDQWESDKEQDFFVQLKRLSLCKIEKLRRATGALRLKERLSRVSFRGFLVHDIHALLRFQ